MKNKAFAPLIEQICMIAVFAIVAAVCIGGFSMAYNISRETERKDAAVLLAQNTAEQLKGGSITLAGETLVLCYDAQLQPTAGEDAEYTVTVTSVPTQQALLCGARITVYYADEALFALTVHYQEGIQR